MAMFATSGNAHMAQQQASAPGSWHSECTVILMGIACRLTREDVKHLLDEAGLRGKFSFIYAPRIVARKSNLGYAFVRFRAMEYAQECHRICHGRPFGPAAPNKLCDVGLAKNQGDAAAILQLSRRRLDGEDPGLLFCCDPIPEPAPVRRPPMPWGAQKGSASPPPPGLEAPRHLVPHDAPGVADEASMPKTMGPRGFGRSPGTHSASSKSQALAAPSVPFVAELSAAASDLFEDEDLEPFGSDFGAPRAPFGLFQVLSF